MDSTEADPVIGRIVTIEDPHRGRIPARVLALVTDAIGDRYAVCEWPSSQRMFCQAIRIAVFADLTPAPTPAVEEFEAGVKQARKAAEQDRRAAEFLADARRYGIVVYETTSPMPLLAVRVTKTRIVCVVGNRDTLFECQYNRTSGSKIGTSRIGRGLDTKDVEAIERFAAGRERVDIVAERKSAASKVTQ